MLVTGALFCGQAGLCVDGPVGGDGNRSDGPFGARVCRGSVLPRSSSSSEGRMARPTQEGRGRFNKLKGESQKP